MNTINATTFARASYTLAAVSTVLVALAIASALVPEGVISNVGSQLCWMSLPLSAVGAFMGQTARGAIKKQIDVSDPPPIWEKARSGALVNTILIAFGTLGAIITIVINLVINLNP